MELEFEIVDEPVFEFEIIDESEVEFAERSRKPKKTPSMFDDCKPEDRTYWGTVVSEQLFDDGYRLLLGIVSNRIFTSVSRYIVIELDDLPEFRLLKKDDRDHFIKMQNELLHEKQKEWLSQNKE